jgi:hypothetical protein
VTVTTPSLRRSRRFIPAADAFQLPLKHDAFDHFNEVTRAVHPAARVEAVSHPTMSIEVKRKTVDVVFEINEKRQLMGNVIHPPRSYREEEKVLRLHFSLMGEVSPSFASLPTDYSLGDAKSLYRYDWIVGLTPVAPAYDWDWWGTIATERALVVQLLIDPGESDCGFTDLNALLLALQPSKDTSSWLDRNAERLGNSLGQVSEFTGQLTGGYADMVTNIVKTSAIMSNFIASGEKGKKNWFIYRFLDQTRRCTAVEWNISQEVLHQYGPVLRGSILLAFHGARRPAKPLTLLLRPRLHFSNEGMTYSPPEAQLESSQPVELAITPETAE